MALKDWSTTALNNSTVGSINFAEGQSAGSLNNSARQLMADSRTFYEEIEWRDWGHTITYLTSTSFKVTGDYTSVYHAQRRVRAVGTSTGTIYGAITSSSLSGGETTVVVTWDSGSLTNETLAVSLGISVTGRPYETFPAGTRLLFQQATAPTGWTAQDVYGDRAIRVVKDGFYTSPAAFVSGVSEIFGASKQSGTYALTTADIPSHTHPMFAHVASVTGMDSAYTGPVAYWRNGGADVDYLMGETATAATVGVSGASGGSGGHYHNVDLDLSYLDCIIGVKD